MEKKAGILLNILILAVIVAAVILIVLYVPGIKKSEDGIERECNFDNDCVKMQITCCSCNSGGEEKCIPTSKTSEYERNLSACPQNLICPMVYNCNIESCECQEGKCTDILK